MAIQNNAPYEKTAFVRFFSVYFEKFWKLLLINVIFFVVATVDLVLLFGVNTLLNNFGLLNGWTVLISFLIPSLLGPFIAALTKLCRDFVREVPGFFWTDFTSALKTNWKQGFGIAFFQNVIILLLWIALPTYYNNMEHGAFYYIGFGACLLVAVILLFMSYYMYMMAVSLRLKLRDIIKNSAIFAFLCLWRNLGLTVLLLVVALITFAFVYAVMTSSSGLMWGLLIAFCMLILFGFLFYLVSWFSFPPIKKFILDRYYEEHPEESSAGLTHKVEPAADMRFEPKKPEGEVSEYVYHNGKMVHRSAFEAEQLFTDAPDDQSSEGAEN